jgi:hypothetical protein
MDRPYKGNGASWMMLPFSLLFQPVRLIAGKNR